MRLGDYYWATMRLGNACTMKRLDDYITIE